VLHCATSLAQLDGETSASAVQLATYFDVPAAYLAKQLQSLVKAGVLRATTGPRGGFRLARPADDITLLDIVDAIDGVSPPFVCREIRQRGRGALPAAQCDAPCILAATMAAAHEAWRHSLRSVTLADILDALPAEAPARTRRLLTQ
jgi:Rrf2 family protein